MSATSHDSKGFTLIELLVVISIIGVLSTIAMTSLNGARIKARDTKRKAEIEQIQQALELYYADHGSYPSSGGAVSPNNGWSNSNDSSWSALGAALSPYMSMLPMDPKNSTPGWAGSSDVFTYTYYSLGYGCGQQWYMLVYRTETSTAVSPGVITCDGTNFNYTGTVTVGMCKGC